MIVIGILMQNVHHLNALVIQRLRLVVIGIQNKTAL
jgi:hypothetical protein